MATPSQCPPSPHRQAWRDTKNNLLVLSGRATRAPAVAQKAPSSGQHMPTTA